MQQRVERPRSGMSTTSGYGDHAQQTKGGPFIDGNLKLLDTIDCPSDVLCCRFNHDGSLLAVGFTDGTIRIYEATHHRLLYSLADEDTQKIRLPVTQIRFRIFGDSDKIEYQNMLIATYASGDVKVWHYTSQSCLHTIHEVRQTLALAISPLGRRFVTAGADEQIHVYDEETKTKINTLQASDSNRLMDGHRERVFSAIYHPTTPHVFITGGWDDTIQYWDDRERHSVRHFHGPHICGDSLDIDAEHNHILTGSWRKDNALQIWDFPLGKFIKDVPPEPLNASLVNCCQWLGKDSIIAGGSLMHMARIIDRGTLNTTGQFVELPQGVYCVDNDRQGLHPKIAMGCSHYIYFLRGEKKN
ncbi:WD repeat-containing protein 38-like [Mizuhopecten yessoensis]|uniref:WD repeat-containing protein 5B n=1 Tax=Mizuhopecten yessoensis TaxID=6573 RepID=A0A210PGJ0_MIZYE|nr:WD repeat-containing protein 38-like [Mizuhopecten yessoensis]OWF35598.1 WD repeat-containing protein 5B [Mizuhopecten yessoensis]